jgi:hypothetical protein
MKEKKKNTEKKNKISARNSFLHLPYGDFPTFLPLFSRHFFRAAVYRLFPRFFSRTFTRLSRRALFCIFFTPVSALFIPTFSRYSIVGFFLSFCIRCLHLHADFCSVSLQPFSQRYCSFRTVLAFFFKKNWTFGFLLFVNLFLPPFALLFLVRLHVSPFAVKVWPNCAFEDKTDESTRIIKDSKGA